MRSGLVGSCVIAKKGGGAEMEDFFQLAHQSGDGGRLRSRGGELACELVERRRALLGSPLESLALAQSGGEVANDEGHREEHSEHHHIVRGADVEGEDRGDEEVVPEQSADRREKKGRGAAQVRGRDHDGEQIEQRDGPVANPTLDEPADCGYTDGEAERPEDLAWIGGVNFWSGAPRRLVAAGLHELEIEIATVADEPSHRRERGEEETPWRAVGLAEDDLRDASLLRHLQQRLTHVLAAGEDYFGAELAGEREILLPPLLLERAERSR